MIAAAFFLGTVIGIAAMILLALYLAAQPKPENKPQPTGIAVAGISMNGSSGSSIDRHSEYLLKKALSNADLQKIFETRH
jgi:hypothetical protein